MAEIDFGVDWVCTGYSRDPNSGEWIEVGSSAGITMTPEPMPPELGLHDVANKLNALERNLATREREYRILSDDNEKLD